MSWSSLRCWTTTVKKLFGFDNELGSQISFLNIIFRRKLVISATQVFKPIKIYYILPKKTEKNPNPINISHTLPKKPPDSFSEKNNPTKISYIYPKKKQDFLYFPKKTNLPISFERADN